MAVGNPGFDATYRKHHHLSSKMTGSVPSPKTQGRTPSSREEQKTSSHWYSSQEKKAYYRSESLRFQPVLIDTNHVQLIDEDGLLLS